MTIRARLPIAGPYGTFAPGAVISGVPAAVTERWVRDGAAETATKPVDEAPAASVETGTATPAETATKPVRQRRAR